MKPFSRLVIVAILTLAFGQASSHADERKPLVVHPGDRQPTDPAQKPLVVHPGDRPPTDSAQKPLTVTQAGPAAPAAKPEKKRPKKDGAVAAPAAPNAAQPVGPAPGTCNYKLQTMKVCTTLNGSGAFDVYVAPTATVTIRLPEWPPRGVVTPDARYYSAEYNEKTSSLSIEPLQDVLPDKVPMVVTTSTGSLSFILRPATAERLDTQVEIRDPDLDLRKVAVDREVNERVKLIEDEYQKRVQALNDQAEARAEELLLTDLAGGRLDVRTLERRDSNSSLILIRGEQVVRFGDRRYIVFTVDNQDEHDFDVKNVQVTMVTGDAKRPLKVTWQFSATKIGWNKSARAAVLLPIKMTLPAKASFTVRVEETDPARSVELGGIRLP